ncbi:USP6 N-terminal-like protein [Lepus europaeus]|uniref:USP6 N-terminal-like protein n=1 Tax=Lepus europaeus TaxID=9983 RepID=UPI002B48728C|nr:USP6 N-terminal-like protein [Lepus europaeus]
MNALRSRRAQERAAIIMQYEQGRRGAALVQPEEEDDEGGCLVPDRLGFLHEQKLPQDSIPGAKRTQVRRTQKWVKMIKNYSKYHGSKKFQRRIYKGIPAQVRGKVWAVLLEVDRKKAQNPGTYAEMKEQARLGATHFHHIDSAITWTFRNHLMFRERYGMNQQALFNILMAYSVYNPEVGYSQGLSHVVALLLMYMPEEDSFWALVQLMQNRKHAMHGFYKPNSPKLERFQHHLGDTVHRVLPSLEKHLEKEGVCLEDSTAHWYLQCFLEGVPFPLALRMWDVYIFEGEHVLTCMAYTALKIHRKRLLKMPRDHLREFLQVTLKQAWSLSEDAVIRQLRASMRELGKHQCLLPPEAKAIERCGRPLGRAHVPQKHLPAPTAPKPNMAIQDTAAVWEQTRGPPACAVPIHPPESFGLRIAVREGSPEPLGLGSPVGTAESPSVGSPTESSWGRGGLCQCASLPNLSGPGPREDDSSDDGSREGLWMWAPPQALEPPEPGPMQAVPAWGPRLKTAPYRHGSPTQDRGSGSMLCQTLEKKKEQSGGEMATVWADKDGEQKLPQDSIPGAKEKQAVITHLLVTAEQ